MPKKWTEKEIQLMKDHILEQMSQGKSLRSILNRAKKKGPELPSRKTIHNWINPNHPSHDESFLLNYAQAREDQADLNAEHIEDIAMNVLKGKVDPASARVAIDALKWTAGKKRPKKYGDKLNLEHEGEINSQIHIFHIPDNGRDKPEDG